METKETPKKTFEEYDIVCLPSVEYSPLVLHKGRDLHQTKIYGSPWLKMRDTYADLYVLANVETDKYKGQPCEDGAVCFAHKTKPCDKCGRYQGRSIVSSTNKKFSHISLIPESYLSGYVNIANNSFFGISTGLSDIKKITLQTRLAGVCCSPMPEFGIRHHSDCDKCSGYTEEYIPKTDADGCAIVKPEEKSSCDRHQTFIDGYNGSMKMLADDIGNMHYESLSELLGYLSEKLHDDAVKDRDNGRKLLSENLSKASSNIGVAQINIERAWEISKPYMK